MRVLPNGRRLVFFQLDFNFLIYVTAAYVTAYFFLTCFLALIYACFSTEVTKCKIPILKWF